MDWVVDFKRVCVECLTSNVHLFLGYAIVAFLLWLALNYDQGEIEEAIPEGMLPRPPTDISSMDFLRFAAVFRRTIIDQLTDALGILRHQTLVWLVKVVLAIFRTVYGIRGNGWDYLRAFKAALIFYFILIPLPAAFMPPVGAGQIEPSAALLIATIALILINAVGDAISINFSVKIYKTAIVNQSDEDLFRSYDKRILLFSRRPESDLEREVQFYLTLLIDFAIATLCLIGVLMISSVLYGIQIGEFSFSKDPETLGLMWEAAKDFWRLSSTFYWFANDPEGFSGQPGIPGMLIFSITTYLPTLCLAVCAVIWLFLLPLRILLSTRLNNKARLAVSQVLIYVGCIVITVATAIDWRDAYAFFITT